MADAPHEPVMLEEVMSWLAPRPGGTYVDCTGGFGGHTEGMRQRLEGSGRIITIDCDPAAYAYCIKRFEAYKNVVRCYNSNFVKVKEVLAAEAIASVDGMLVDCGVSSVQIDEPARGFSFRHAGPLDMRMDPRNSRTAETALRDLTENELADVIYLYGDERKSRRIARAVKEAWRRGEIRDTLQLAETVKRTLPRGYEHGRIHPATRTFQALRIWVNDELGKLEKFLGEAVGLLRPGGRLAAISFHSLEDRMIKHTFRRTESGSEGAMKVLTRKPIEPTDAEAARNPRSRSAKLRILERRAV
jgi:16S rRNA (cytosine1402-N4)-methyltransferase